MLGLKQREVRRERCVKSNRSEGQARNGRESGLPRGEWTFFRGEMWIKCGGGRVFKG